VENTAQYVKSDDAQFPSCLLGVKPKIKGIWHRGDYEGESWEKMVAVVGSRKMSRYGKQVISEVVPRLVESGYTIVSGLMYGVDQEAHKETLKVGGRAVAVLGYGIDHFSEEGAWKLSKEIVSSGGLVISEYEADVRGQVWTFPQRNRIVVGMSEMVIIIEAGEKSGSLNTASHAVRQEKPIYVGPGSVFSPTSTGTNMLLANGVARGLTMESLLELTGKTFGMDAGVMTSLKVAEREFWTRLKLDGPSSANELMRKLGKEMGEILSTLAQMEMKGVVKEERGVWRIC